MNFKIIETPMMMPDVLLYRDRNADGDELVCILAIGQVDNEENMFANESITFENYDTAQRFICDYTVISAGKWCEKQGISY